MVIYFMPIPIITSIVGVSLTLAFHNNYAEYQIINFLYDIEHGYATHEFIFYKNKSINDVISKYNSLNADNKRKFIESSLRLSEYSTEQKNNIPYFKEISLNNVKEYISLIRNNQTLSYWNKFKQEKIANYLYFQWTAFTTANYLEKISSLNFVNASTAGFISGTIILAFSILGIASILVYYYFSKKNGYEKDMYELGYDVSAKYNYEEKIKFKEENKMSLREKMNTIDVLSKNKEIIDFQNKNSNLGFKNEFLQPKRNIEQNNSKNDTSNKLNNSSTSRININNIISKKKYDSKKIDLESTRKINLFKKQIMNMEKKNKKGFFSKKDKK